MPELGVSKRPCPEGGRTGKTTNAGKRILMFTHEFPPIRGGVARYSCELASAAAEIGHEVTVVAPKGDHGETKFGDGGPKFSLRRFHGGIYSRRNLLPLLWRTARLNLLEQFDVIHALDWPHILALAFLNRFKQIPFSATVYGTELLSIPQSRHARWLSGGNPFSAPSQVFAISQFTRSLLESRSPELKSTSVKVTQLGVSSFWFQPVTDSLLVRRKLGIPLDHRLILTVARLDSRKGHHSVMTAMNSLENDLKAGLSYVIVGTGNPSYRCELERIASNLDLSVCFAGNLDDKDVRALYASSSVFCMPGVPHPRRVEGFGLAYLEAAAQGLPAIGTDVGAIPEVVEDGRTGMIVKPGDLRGLRDALARIIDDRTFREQLSRQAVGKARGYTWERTALATYGPAS